MVWGPFLRSLDEDITAAVAALGATLPTMTSRGDTVARKKDSASYCALFLDLEGCGSSVRDVAYRTLDGGWFVKSVLNLLPRGIGKHPTTTMMMGGRRGRGDGTTWTANGNDCKYDNKRGEDGNDECDGLLLLLMWERDLMSVTPAKMDVKIVCLRA